MVFVRGYLFLYNFWSFCWWFFTLFLALEALYFHIQVFSHVEFSLKIAQSV